MFGFIVYPFYLPFHFRKIKPNVHHILHCIYVLIHVSNISHNSSSKLSFTGLSVSIVDIHAHANMRYLFLVIFIKAHMYRNAFIPVSFTTFHWCFLLVCSSHVLFWLSPDFANFNYKHLNVFFFVY